MNHSLQEQLAQKGNIPDAHMKKMITDAEHDMLKLGELLITHRWLDRDTVGVMIGDSLGRSYLNLSKTLFKQDALNTLTREQTEHHGVIPVYMLENIVTLTMSDPNNTKKLRHLEHLIGKPISPVFSLPDEIQTAVMINYESSLKMDDLAGEIDFEGMAHLPVEEQSKALNALVSSKPVADLCESLLRLALKDRASDIHMEPKQHECLFRFRVDGVMMKKFTLPLELYHPMLARYKLLAEMDITEHLRPQDGRLGFQLPTQVIDLRMSTLPTLYGEKVVMRILGNRSATARLNIEKLDLSQDILREVREVLAVPNGILLVTGPTGSGKSTTLYAALNYLNKPENNIITIEDPVEYQIPSLNQVPVDDKVGRSFATILRSVLRQDPDIILVGEIRDAETARTATQAALTGHMVLTTLHTNDAVSALTRLVDMGVETFIVAPSIVGVMAQRLVRRICEHCREAWVPDEDYMRCYFEWNGDIIMPTLYRGKGCENCSNTGYFGRLGVHEFLRVTPALQQMMLQNKTTQELRTAAIQSGYRPLRYDGLKKVLRGMTTVEEVLRISAGE
ncbi:MAG: GspE/PulE family protein [Mariprofundaceae bacterium]|nr:GspE/PulE family protein [Mariprofundaceae bacterium]